MWEAVSDGQDILNINGYEVSSRAYVGRFNFKGNDQQKRLNELSGGESTLLALSFVLATSLYRPSPLYSCQGSR